MSRLGSILGYGGAVLVLLAALLTPFVLYGWFQNLIGSLGLRIHPTYSGGEVAFILPRDGYSGRGNRPVLRETPWQRVAPFVQSPWTPAQALPERVREELDIDGDGARDALVEFAVPRDPAARLEVKVTPRGGKVQAVQVRGTQSMSALAARVKDTIVVRLPVPADAG
jgi:hypothetical protein